MGYNIKHTMPEVDTEEVAIFLTALEIESFKLFQKYHSLFTTLKEEGIFDIKFGKCIINIAYGEVQNVVKEEVVFKK